MNPSPRILALLTLACGAAVSLPAQMVRVTVTNLASQNPTGLYHSPVWLGFHDGTFDIFDSGTTASASVEALAELGDSSLLNASFVAAQPGAHSLVLNSPGGPGPGIFTPGASNSTIVDLSGGGKSFLSFGAMIVPSNDTFIANGNPTALPLFDSSGNFLGAQRWTLTGAQTWDAGTEVNNPLDGSAFVAGVNAILGIAEGGMIHAQPLDGLNNVLGLMTPAGTEIGRALTNEPLVSIAITPVPEPSTYGFMAAVGLAAVIWWRRRRKAAVS